MDSYGATGGDGSALKTKVMHKRRRFNVVAILLSLIVPWLVYCAVYAARTFSIRQTNPNASKGICGAMLLVVLACCGLAYRQIQMKRSGAPGYEPMWYIFLAVTTLLAWIMGLGSGQLNWESHMSEYFSMGKLNEYWYVDPARMKGAQMMDAGAVNFVNGTHIDSMYSIGFHNDDMYCVAPLNSAKAALGVYDFWVVGMNCCNGGRYSFQCGKAWNNPKANQGLRFMKDAPRAFFRLAVQQAEATYGITAEHPLFFTWVGDAVGQQSEAYSMGWSYFMMGMIAYFFFQLFLVAMASIFFAKVGTY